MRHFLLLLLCLTLPIQSLPAKEEDGKVPVFGEIQFAELLQNPDERKKYEGKIIELVGDLYSLSRPTEKTQKITTIGFGKTYQTTIYRVQCFLSKPMTTQEFEQISRSNFVVVRGRCSIKTKLKEVGSDVWYDFDIKLTQASVQFWEPQERATGEKK